MTSCCPPPPMPWNGATGAIARCKRVSTGCGRKSRSVRALHWICGVKRKPKAVNKPWHHCIVHGLDKPGVFTTVSENLCYCWGSLQCSARQDLIFGPCPTRQDPIFELSRPILLVRTPYFDAIYSSEPHILTPSTCQDPIF